MPANQTSCASALGPLFRKAPAAPAALLARDVAFHSLPACATLALWLLVESSRTRRGLPRSFGHVAVAIALAAAAGAALCLWRTLELAACAGGDLAAVAGWRWPITVGAGLAQLLLAVALGPRFVRSSTLALLLAAGLLLAAEWAIGVLAGAVDAALPLVAAQQLACLQAVALLAHLPAPRAIITLRPAAAAGGAAGPSKASARRPAAAASLVELDALARRSAPDASYPGNRYGGVVYP